MNAFAALLAENRRLEILRALALDADYTLNVSLLGQILAAAGLASSTDQLRTDLAWLEEQGLLVLSEESGVIRIARATQRGVDAARGLARVPGVARPGPED